MGGDAIHLAHEHADPRCPCWDLDTKEFLGCQREDQFVEERGGVIHAGDVGATLEIGQALAGLFHPGVQVTDDGLGPKDGFAIHLQHQAKHTVGGWMARTHVDQHGLIGFVVQRRIGQLCSPHFAHA